MGVAQPIVFAGGVASDSQEFSVSCSGLTCVAAGAFVGTGINEFAMTDTSSDGGLTWDVAQPATFAAGVQDTNAQTTFTSISCSGSTCVAAGQYLASDYALVAMTETSTDAGLTWATPQPVSFASGVQYASPYADFNAVSCSGSTCVAAGEFQDVSGSVEAMTQTTNDSGATWSTARPATFATGVQYATPTSYFYAVSCTSLTCVTAGQFVDPQSAYEAMTDTNIVSSSISPITNLYVTQSGPALSATWTASAGATSYTCTLLFGFNTPSTFTTTVPSAACAFTGLSTTTPYGVSVVSNGPDGSSSSVSAFGAPTPTTTSTIHKVPRPVERTIVCVRAKKVSEYAASIPPAPPATRRDRRQRISCHSQAPGHPKSAVRLAESLVSDRQALRRTVDDRLSPVRKNVLRVGVAEVGSVNDRRHRAIDFHCLQDGLLLVCSEPFAFES